MRKIERLFFIVNYLSNHEYATAKELASHCNSSTRTIYRDIQLLEENGFFILREGKAGYKLIEKPLANVNLNSTEILAFTLFPLLPQRSKTNGYPFYQAYQSALKKIGLQTTDKNSLFFINQLGKRILYQEQENDQQKNQFMADIIYAISSNHSVWIEYYSIYRNAVSDRVVDPYYLVPRAGHLYIVGWCHNRNAIRIFRLNRIHNLIKTNQTFTIRPDFHINDFLNNRWSIFGEDDTTTTFKVRFDKTVARYIEEMEHYVKTSTEMQKDGSLLLIATVKSKAEFLRWIKQFGSKAEVLEPQSERKKLLQEAKELIKLYNDEKYDHSGI